jgi:protein O-mannosyl-transferase
LRKAAADESSGQRARRRLAYFAVTTVTTNTARAAAAKYSNFNTVPSPPHQLQSLLPPLIALITFISFFPALGNQFVNWDDDVMLVDNPHFRGLGWTQLAWMFSTFHAGHFQPLAWITYGFDYLLWGNDPFGYHLTSLVLHIGNALLFFALCRRLFLLIFAGASTGCALDLSAASAAILFALHPLRVESVVWATERRDVLSALFFLVALLFYLRAFEQGQISEARNRGCLALAFVAQLLSLLAKATAITLPLVLLLLDFFPLRRWHSERRRVLWEKAPFIFLSTVFGVIALMAQHGAGALRPLKQYFWSYRVGQGFYGIYFYLWKTLAPFQLSPIYELPYDLETWAAVFVACAAFVVLVSFLAALYFRRWPWLLASWVYYVIVLAPVLGFAQSGPQLVADRYSYLSCLSWAALAGGLLLYWMSNSSRWFFSLAVIAVAAFSLGLLARAQVSVWRDPETLWKHVLKINPNTAIAHYNLAKVHEGRGERDSALEHYRQAVEVNPTYADAHHNLARLLAQQGNSREAITHYIEALKFKPQDAETYNNLGQLLAFSGDPGAAFAAYRKALELDPKFAKAYFNLGRLQVRKGEFAESIENFQRALTLAPDTAEVHAAIGEAYLRAGDNENAIAHFTAAIKLKPELIEVRAALSRLTAKSHIGGN